MNPLTDPLTERAAALPLSRRAALLGAAAAVLMPGAGRALAAARPIAIGVSAPLTAQFAQDGAWMKQGIALAVTRINKAGGIRGRPVALHLEDDQGPNPTAAANAVTRLITEDEVVAMIGPHFTPGMLPCEPLFEQYKVPALTGATGPVVTEAKNPWIFRVRLNDAVGAALLVSFVLDKLGWKRIGLDYVNTAFGQSGIAAVKSALAARKARPAAVQTHLDSTEDFTSQILAFEKAGVDGIIVWTDDQPSGLIAKQMKTLGAKFGLAGSTSFSQPPFLRLAGDAANGAYAITDFVQDNPSPAIQAWMREYRAVYGQAPELYASTYHDATNLLAAAMRAAPTLDGTAIRAALTKIHDFPGVMTRYSWSPGGDMVHSGLITKVENGRPVILETVHQAA